MPGINPEPMASYSLAGRFICDKCKVQPNLISAEGRDPVIVKLECHGETLTASYTKNELVFTQHVFLQEE